MQFGALILPEYRWSEAAPVWKRAEEMGASLQVDAVPGVGTRIMIQKQIHPNG